MRQTRNDRKNLSLLKNRLQSRPGSISHFVKTKERPEPKAESEPQLTTQKLPLLGELIYLQVQGQAGKNIAEKFNQIVEELGGKVAKVFSQKCTLVISNYSSSKIQARMLAMSNPPPLVTLLWLQATSKKMQKLPVQPYQIRPMRPSHQPPSKAVRQQQHQFAQTQVRLFVTQFLRQWKITAPAEQQLQADQI